MKLKTVLVVGGSIAAGMAIANYLTEGAVMDAVSDVAGNVKDKFFNKGAQAVEVATDAVEEVADAATDIVSDVTDSI